MSRCLFVAARGAAAFAAPTDRARDASRGGASGIPSMSGTISTSVVFARRLGGPSRRLRTVPTRAHAGGDASDTAGDVPSEPRGRPSQGTVASAKEAASRLDRSMAAAVAAEDYALAASIRDELNSLREGDALLAATARLADAVRLEDYAEAAKLRDLISGGLSCEVVAALGSLSGLGNRRHAAGWGAAADVQGALVDAFPRRRVRGTGRRRRRRHRGLQVVAVQEPGVEAVRKK